MLLDQALPLRCLGPVQPSEPKGLLSLLYLKVPAPSEGRRLQILADTNRCRFSQRAEPFLDRKPTTQGV